MTSAELVFKTGFGPNLTVDQLSALAYACRTDDKRLVQGSTTTPPPLQCVEDWPCEAGCGITYMGVATGGGFADVMGRAAMTIGAAEEFFAQMCFRADQTMGEPAACRWFLNWFDETPRDEMRRELEKWCRELIEEKQSFAALTAA